MDILYIFDIQKDLELARHMLLEHIQESSCCCHSVMYIVQLTFHYSDDCGSD